MSETPIIERKLKIEKRKGSSKRLVIISDTHIATSGYEYNRKIFSEGMRQINRIKNVDLYIHLGDLTQSGTLADYEFAMEQMAQFNPVSKAPLEYIIGNHDAKNVGYLLFEELIGERHFEYEDDDIYIVGIDSTKPDLPGGAIHHRPMNAVKKRLVIPERRNKLKVVCFHHQLIPIPNTGKERSAIDDSGDMLKMLLETRTDLVLNGHRHISNLHALRNPNRDLYIFNAGTFCCNKTRYRELYTYSVIDINQEEIIFKIVPILDRLSNKIIHRNITTRELRGISTDEIPYCKFIQMSDSLISRNFKGSETTLDKAIKEINKFKEVDLVVHLGNLTKNSFEEEFKIARKKLDRLHHPWLAVPGYTDSKPPSWEYWDRFIGSLDPVFENEKLLFQGINSTTQDSKMGFVGRKKLSKVIEKVLSLSHEKVIGVGFYHCLIPSPLSVWRTELIDAGDVLSQFARSQIGIVMNSSPSICFNIKVDNSIFSNCGNLKGEHFPEVFNEINIYKDGLVTFTAHNVKTSMNKLIAKYQINLLI